MRTTTELTARFDLAITALPVPNFAENCDAPLGSIEYWEAFERDQAREDMDLLDALDFDLVPFEQVEADLALELFEQDAAEERANDFGLCRCAKCSREDHWGDHLIFIAGKHFCPGCKPTGYQVVILEELDRKRQERSRAQRIARAKKWRAALAKAKELRPDLNWAQFDFDHRMFA